MMSDGEVRRLIKEAQQGSRKAMEILIEENIGLIKSVAARFCRRGAETEDLFQIGAMGFIKCIKKFDFKYDVRLSTYAVPMIMGEIKRFLRDDGQIKVSRSLKELAVKVKYLSEEIKKATGQEPNAESIAKELNVKTEEVVLALEAAREPESLDAKLYGNDSGDLCKIDRVMIQNDDDKIDDGIVLKQAIGELSERDRQIIKLRYFEDRTQTEISRMVGVSQVQVSRIEKRILKGLREKLR